MYTNSREKCCKYEEKQWSKRNEAYYDLKYVLEIKIWLKIWWVGTNKQAINIISSDKPLCIFFVGISIMAKK